MPLLEWISYILTLSGLFVIMGFVAARNFRSAINQKFIYFAASVALYVGASFMSEVARPIGTALFWTRTALFFACFIPITFYMFTIQFTQYKLKRKWVTPAMYIATLIVAPISYLPTAIVAVKYDIYGTSIYKTGPALLITMVFLIVGFATSMWILHKVSRQMTGSDRTQVRLIIYGVGIAAAVNIITQLVLAEFNITALGDLLGTPSNLLLVGAVGYAIVRHRLFDIKSAVLRSLVYVMGIVTVIFFYCVAIYLITNVVVKDFILPISLAFYFIASSVVLALTFPVALRVYQRLTDRLFYRDRYDAQALLNTISRLLAGSILLEQISEQTLKTIAENMRIDRADLIVLNEGQIYFSSPTLAPGDLAEIYPKLGLFADKITIIDSIEYGKRREFLSNFDITALVKLETNNKIVGYLLLGDKLSGYMYSQDDITVLDTVSTELSVAIQNAMSFSQISHFNETLKVRIAQATKELSAANVKLHELDAAKDDFISMASHQLRTPIAAISGYITLLLDKIYANDPVRYDLTLKKALHISENMGALVNDLLNVSRMDTGRFYLDKRPVDVGKIILEEVDQLQLQAKRVSTQLIFIPAPQPIPMIMADEEKIRQAVMNLITNAIAYTPNGKVQIELDLVGTSIVFKVVDNGIGVPEAEKSRLFQRFYRAENAQKIRTDGTGLGLYLVRRVVEDHGGSIIFSSRVGSGSTFGFRIPLHSSVPTRELPKPEPLKPELTRRLN